MILIPKEDRINRLLENGIPKGFLEKIGEIKELEFSVEKPERAYYYIPTIANYEIIKGCEITPIYDCGESFYVLAQSNENNRIIKFELENDEIYKDYSLNWNLLLLEIMIDYFDNAIEDNLSIEMFESVGEKIEFKHSKELFVLRNLSIEAYNSKYENDEKWRKEIAEELKII